MGFFFFFLQSSPKRLPDFSVILLVELLHLLEAHTQLPQVL